MQIPLKQTICASFVVTALLLPITSQAATYYVAPTGNDARTCTQAKSASAPKKTISAGVQCLAGGDTLIIKAGTYVNQQITNPPAGTASAYTVIKGDPSGPRPVILPNKAAYQRGFHCSRGETCRYIEMRHLEIRDSHNDVKLDGSATIGYAHHLRFIDNYFFGGGVGFLITSSPTGYLGGDHLIQSNIFEQKGRLVPGYSPGINSIYNPGNRSIIEGNTFRNVQCGVTVRLNNTLIRDVIVRRNAFYDVNRPSIASWQVGQGGQSAILIAVGGGGHRIYNNIIYRSGETAGFAGIRVTPYGGTITIPIHIYNNTIYDLRHSGAQAVMITPTTGGPYYVKNNIAYMAGLGFVRGTQSNNLKTNPSFKSAAGADFRLLSGSAAIDKGVILSVVPTDFSGARRPAGSSHDIGAYETNATSALMAPTSLSAQ